MKYLITNKTRVLAPADWPVATRKERLGELRVILEDGNIPSGKGSFLLHDGYLRDLKKEVQDLEGQQQSVMQALSAGWPLADNYTGSFSAALIDTEEEQIVLCTDQVGLYPLYYLQKDDLFYVSNSIILLGAVSGCEVDEAGIVQRTLGPEFATLGSRTILEGCKRLLPGEYLKFDFNGRLLQQEFDNRLFQQITEPSSDDEFVHKYWRAYKKEVEYCVNYSTRVNVALSGGIDSRLVLGTVPTGKDLECFTYGHPTNYETRVAAELCRLKKGNFNACYHPDLYFPDPETFRRLVIDTEALELCSWLEITESIDEKRKEPLLLGELCEALPARNIKSFSSKEFRKKNFVKYYIQDKDYPFIKADASNFEGWKKKIRHQFKIYYHERNLQKYNFNGDRDHLLKALQFNLEELFTRIESHHLPYAELYDELFSWYTYTRMRLSKHLQVANSKFDAYSPAMSLQMLTLTSRIHPNQRLNYRFAKQLFRAEEELKSLSKVPTAQAPLVPQNFPDLLKFTMWGIRSTADQYFINKMMKKKDPESRYRLFNSINWAKVYQHPQMERNLEAYFEPNEIGQGFYKELYNQAIARKELKQWPFANLNIINAASLNVELNSIKELRENAL